MYMLHVYKYIYIYMYIPGTPKQPEGQGRFPMVAKNPYTKRGSLGKPLTTPFFLLGGPGIYIIIYIYTLTYIHDV